MQFIFIVFVFLNLLNCFSITAKASKCITAGCSNEKCINSNLQEQAQMGICIWQEEFTCYQKYGQCTNLEDGSCGWQQTELLKKCLKNKQKVLVPWR